MAEKMQHGVGRAGRGHDCGDGIGKDSAARKERALLPSRNKRMSIAPARSAAAAFSGWVAGSSLSAIGASEAKASAMVLAVN